jgi:hypothetical protein
LLANKAGPYSPAARQRFAPNRNLGSSAYEWRRLRSLRNMMGLCHISDMDIDYAECRCAGGGRPVAARRANGTPDYGDAGIYREGHRASSKAKPRRDATSVSRSSERLICRCRGQIGPESDGAAPTSTRSQRQAATLVLAGDGPAMPSAQRLTNEHSIGLEGKIDARSTTRH